MNDIYEKQKYSIGEKVTINGWVSQDYGIVEDIRWVYHHRLEKYSWGYKINYLGKGAGLAFLYVPEGYIGIFNNVLKE